MASAIALRGATASNLFNKKLLNPVRYLATVPSSSRPFNTSAQKRDSDNADRSVAIDRRPEMSVSRRRESPVIPFTDVFDPFSQAWSLSQVMNLMDQFMEDPFLAASRGMGAGSRGAGWDVKEDEEALYVRMDMPGLGKEDVKVLVEQNTLVIKGEGQKESEEEESGRRYTSRLDLPQNLYKLDQIKAEMKNGVLKVVVPKVKEEERKDVVQVPIE
ncbi:hypothetical protein HHK36_027976 [Tetracentron sinense]|uniref:SHSP domain-containing protein n=1 Tax=Tetracentron sinense TaxID=13715 RepID=A0A834YFS0_TETSI|nr:hypothetical protein HHK36_027976 [Tetracentron sinense]